MSSSIENLESKSFLNDDFTEGKLSALRILFESYQELQIKGIKEISTGELLSTIRTLILNLEEQSSEDLEEVERLHNIRTFLRDKIGE